jgi:Kdo2-lipid IVA lauroyltransferase/acyltransferase
LPLPVGLWLGRRVGDLAHAVVPRRRSIALRNLCVAFPAMTRPERRRLCRDAYRHLGMMSVEVCRLLRDPTAALERVSLEGREHIDRVMATCGRGLVLTAHLGNWELLTLAPILTGHPVAMVVRPLDSAWLDSVVRQAREASGADVIAKTDALRPVLEALRRGGLVAILLDQNTSRREGVFVPFFGRPASTSRSVAVLALRTGAPILPAFIRRESGGRHRIRILPALHPPIDRVGEEAVIELTRQCTETIERAIRDAPEQWLWMHDRWRTRPAVEREVAS